MTPGATVSTPAGVGRIVDAHEWSVLVQFSDGRREAFHLSAVLPVQRGG